MQGNTSGRYLIWLALLAALNIAVWFVVESAYCVDLAGKAGDLWSVRMYLASGLLLFDNLCVVWWYARVTSEQVIISKKQFALAESQFTVAEESLRRSEHPCVVIEWKRLQPAGDDGTYVARNIGPGTAINVVHVEDLAADRLRPTHLGALASGQEVEVPRDLKTALTEEETHPLDRKRHVILAQTLYGDRWIATGNLMQQGRRLSHRVQTITLTEAQQKQIDRQTVEEYVHEHWTEIRQEMQGMLDALRAEE